MLEILHIRNLALVPELELEFGPGLNTVTGETGAGKSLIIGAIQLLAGGRAAASLIRKGEKSCEITGTFCFASQAYPELQSWLNKFLDDNALPPMEEDRLLVRRVITESGSRAYINGSSVPAAALRDVCARLVDIHGPNDTQGLLHNSRQLELLDDYSALRPELDQVAAQWKALQAVRQQYAELCQETLAPEEAELLKYQLREIEDAAPGEDEEQELVQKHRRLSNSQVLIQSSNAAVQSLTEGEGSLTDRLADIMHLLRKIEQADPEHGQHFSEAMDAISESIYDISRELEEYATRLDVDEETMHELEERLDLLQKLKRKYGPTLPDVLATAERLRARLERFANRNSETAALQKQEQELTASHLQACQALHAKRQAGAEKLSQEIARKLKDLGFNQARFEIKLQEATPGPRGTDAVEFCFAPNPGEDINPLKDTASSGEIARVMLAIKTVLSDVDRTPILIFDEIDANIGGLVATAVARQMRDIGQRHQLFCITHLPVIAAAGAAHFQVSKQVQNERTTTRMVRLEHDKRVEEIMRMMGSTDNSDTARQHAQTLIDTL